MPRISVIVPIYNSERYLRECIESVIGQSFVDMELVLVDDGSTDSSPDICSEYAAGDGRIKVVTQPNGGLSAARNKGIDAASGEYLFFIDSDDTIHHDALSALYDVAERTDTKIVAGLPVIAENYVFEKAIDRDAFRICDAEELIADILYQKKDTDNSACWKLFRAELFDDTRFRDGWFEDLDIFYRLYEKAGKIALIDSVIYFYRRHADSFINSWSPQRLDILGVTERMSEYMKAKGRRLHSAAEHRRFSAYYNVYVGLMLNQPAKENEIKRCRKVIKQLRRAIIFDRQSRLKNRVGAIASYIGSKFVKKLAKWDSRYCH